MNNLAGSSQYPASDNKGNPLSGADRSQTWEDLLTATNLYTGANLQESKGQLQPDEKSVTDALEPLFVAQISDPNRCVRYDDPTTKIEDRAGQYVPTRRRLDGGAIPCPTDLVYSLNGWTFNRYENTATYPFTYNEVVRQR